MALTVVASQGLIEQAERPLLAQTMRRLFVRFRGEADMHCQLALMGSGAIDPKRSNTRSKSRSAAVSCRTEVCYPSDRKQREGSDPRGNLNSAVFSTPGEGNSA